MSQIQFLYMNTINLNPVNNGPVEIVF